MEVDQSGPSKGWTWADSPAVAATPEAARAAGHPEAKIGPAHTQRTFGAEDRTFADTPNLELNRADNSLLGLPPEVAVLSGLAIGRAMGAAGLTAAGRALAGLKASAAQVTPVLKYEATRHALDAIGISPTVATVAAMAVSGYRKGAKAATADAESAVARTVKSDASPAIVDSYKPNISSTPPTVTTAEAVPAVSPAAGPFKENMARNLLAVERIRAKLPTKLTAEQEAVGLDLMRNGASAKDAVQAITSGDPAAELALRLGTQSDAQVRANLAKRNLKSGPKE